MSEQLEYMKKSCLSYLSRFKRASDRIERFVKYWDSLVVFLGSMRNGSLEELIWEYELRASITMGRDERRDLRRCLTIICHTVRHGLPPEGFHIPICQPFWGLPMWCRRTIRDFQKSRVGVMSSATLSNYEVSLSYFFHGLDLKSVKDTSQLTHRVIIEYAATDKAAATTKRQRNSDVKSFLKYLEELGLVKPTTHLVLEPSFQDEAILLNEEQCNTYPWRDLLDPGKTEPIEVYERGVARLQEYLTEHSYTQGQKNAITHGATEFRLFLHCNGFGYSTGIADGWLEARRPHWAKDAYYNNFRTVHLIRELAEGKRASTAFPHKDRRKYHIHETLERHILAYIEYRRHECLKPSTIAMIRSSCCRFLGFVESLGILDITRLTPMIVKEFNLQDHHSTAEGKQAYNIRIRDFLLFLATRNLLPMSLHLALPAMAAKKDRIISVLTHEQRSAIEAHFKNPVTKLEKRDNAVVALGYDLGIRGIDIIALQFPQIDWDKETLSFRQQKTGVWITMPFTTNVGNALFTYITEARPESDSPYVFLSSKAPHKNMGPAICRNALDRIMRQANLPPCSGFHATRRTFASDLLVSGTPYTTISDFLGHSDNTTLKVYLATNEPEMRQCAMSLQGIEYRGGLL
jgi:integrase